jgi:hypothetical protein
MPIAPRVGTCRPHETAHRFKYLEVDLALLFCE